MKFEISKTPFLATPVAALVCKKKTSKAVKSSNDRSFFLVRGGGNQVTLEVCRGIGVARVLRLGGQMSTYVNLPPVKN